MRKGVGTGGEIAMLSCAGRGYRRNAGTDHNVRTQLEHKEAGPMRRRRKMLTNEQAPLAPVTVD